MKENGIRGYALAEQIGVSPAVLSRFLSGQRLPTVSVAQEIHKATGGAVHWTSWYPSVEDKQAA